MGKNKIPATGEVEGGIEAKAGWPPQLTLKLQDGTVRKGKLNYFSRAKCNGTGKVLRVLMVRPTCHAA
ncbi:MAG TPA: hypothetical protein VFZ59_05905 [Verrucomicrobiae bacterium]|nr:hypothetical protein [Verrucomicrobiae bacterium]